MEVNNSLAVIPSQGIIEDVMPESIPAFIESNSNAITLEELDKDCIIPTFADLNPTISHQSFANTVRQAAMRVFPNDSFGSVECRVSHQINGRTPDAIHLPAKELKPWQMTKFFQRMCFAMELTTLTPTINSQPVRLTIGGVRSLHETNMYGRQIPQKFRIFIGYRVRVCSNMMLTCDGLTESLSCLTEADIFQHAYQLFSNFNAQKTLSELESLSDTTLTTEQFCQFIGRCRLYSAMPEKQKKQLQLPQILLGDSILNAATRGFISNPNFGANGNDVITTWQLMQLLNEAAKQSYIDVWADRNANSTEIALGIQRTLEGVDDSYSWFLN